MRLRIVKIALAVPLFISKSILAQDLFDGINIQTLGGIELPLTSVLKNKPDKPVVLFTWSKEWCWPCVKALNEFDVEYYEQLRDDYNLKFIALNLDKDTESDEIKTFTIENEWYFDTYQDPEGNYMSMLNKTSAPETYLIVDNIIVGYKSGFIKGVSEPEPNADYIYHLITAINSRAVYYDEDWNYSSKNSAAFVRYIDKFNDKYEVRDRWITGELQMRGQFYDKYLTNRTGEFYWYHQNGNVSTLRNYKNGQQDGVSKQWYENGQLWVTELYEGGRLLEVTELYSSSGSTLSKGQFSNGNGFIYRYRADGSKSSKQEYKNGVLDGRYTLYNTDGSVNSTHLYEAGSYKGKEN